MKSTAFLFKNLRCSAVSPCLPVQTMTTSQLSREKSDTKKVLQYYEKQYTRMRGHEPSREDKVRAL